MKKENKKIFEILEVEEQNRFYDSRKTCHGGGYHQPFITFTFNGKTGYISDTSCGDFGTSIYISFGDKYYSIDTLGEYEEESTFSEKCLEYKLLAKHLSEVNYPIRSKEEVEEVRKLLDELEF